MFTDEGHTHMCHVWLILICQTEVYNHFVVCIEWQTCTLNNLARPGWNAWLRVVINAVCRQAEGEIDALDFNTFTGSNISPARMLHFESHLLKKYQRQIISKSIQEKSICEMHFFIKRTAYCKEHKSTATLPAALLASLLHLTARIFKFYKHGEALVHFRGRKERDPAESAS